MLVFRRVPVQRHAKKRLTRSFSAVSETRRIAQCISHTGLYCAAATGGVAAMRWLTSGSRSCDCETLKQTSEDDDDEDDEFEFNFAKPPVVSADIDLETSVTVSGGLRTASRPVAEVTMSSTFSLPVERGWARDANTPEEVAASMCGIIADRFPRWFALENDLDLLGAPMASRGFIGWPSVGGRKPPATLHSRWLPAPFPPLLTLEKLEKIDDEKAPGAAYLLGGVLCAGRRVTFIVICTPLGVEQIAAPSSVTADNDERLDLHLTTSIVGLPLSGRAWIIGGRWWWKRVRLPCTCSLLESFHQFMHDQLALNFVAALAGEAPSSAKQS